jgi:peptidoglycan/LPS O-acetylase OafA/YrhL
LISVGLHVNTPGTSRFGAPFGFTPRNFGSTVSAHLDLIRGLAAWAVMWGHLRALFFVDFPQIQNPGVFLKIIYFLTGFGNEAVLVFFVLSGFLISTAIFSRQASGTWSWRDYAIDRSSRLYVVLLPGLFFGLLWDKLGGSVFASTGIYSQPLESFGSATVQTRLVIGTFLGNLFFVQTILCPTFGSNGPLWSLANEFWYYVLFPLALAAGIAWKLRSWRPAIAVTILAACVAAFLGRPILAGFLIWLAGTALVIAYSKCPLPSKSRSAVYFLFAVLVFSSCLTAARTGRLSLLGSNLAVGIAFALFLFGVLHMDFGTGSRSYGRVASELAGFSYSLYVLHFPLLLFFRAWIVPQQRWQPDPANLGRGALIGLATLGFAWLVAKFTEAKTRVARRWMRKTMPVLDGRAD